MKKFIIDDDAAFMRHMLRGILESEGFVIVTEVANGDETTHLYKQFNPDLLRMGYYHA